ncbi:DUF1837 domain-containing protein [Pseudomonas syringae]|uniref:HamA C-terminal domain-containing protein n=1 Tax=Pseudomonas syringae TaxID=317 RepID=UPI001F45F6EE|nr:DUF1837 domain-containing protein [Pseudomonas syringae]MBL3829402.1 DUF1837 domain-containing protein [Pseudomonas syringae pv. theae]MBL3835400.1 DUF1837 domain-containing protein [Pseudomonas syringae pv. theae]MBL3865909.1 DUF1837 domain-containing protein [Pseudomonas syringae pv. theae]GKQ48204.1 hypothetical protein PSTH2693_23630 [Pseudomonas syringae pv. theae]
MDLTLENDDFLDGFDHLECHILENNTIDIFSLKINANEFNYSTLQDILLDPLINYSLSRKVREEYLGKPAALSRKAREKFVEYLRNRGELGELLLYCFLESHLKAPKILSKLELKTSTSHYVNGADGVHFAKLKDGNFQIIFGESKTEENLTTALSHAFKSIHEFKNEINSSGARKSGLPYEKALISDHLDKEVFNTEEKDFIKKIIYPRKDNNFEVDDAFGIFIGFEIDVHDSERRLPNSAFRKVIQEKIKSEIKARLTHVEKKINEYKLYGHCFYIYILPFTDLVNTRAKIQEQITK